jgi:catechol 2,3-dioxygenase-like lactoylglutathione lyase family enzyme
MNVLRIDHVSLNTADRERTLAFYGDVLGMRTGRAGPPDEPVFAGEDGAQFGLFADRDRPGLRHVALATDQSGYDEMLDRLRERQIPFRVEQHSSGPSIYFKDPDGATIEILVGG